MLDEVRHGKGLDVDALGGRANVQGDEKPALSVGVVRQSPVVGCFSGHSNRLLMFSRLVEHVDPRVVQNHEAVVTRRARNAGHRTWVVERHMVLQLQHSCKNEIGLLCVCAEELAWSFFCKYCCNLCAAEKSEIFRIHTESSAVIDLDEYSEVRFQLSLPECIEKFRHLSY